LSEYLIYLNIRETFWGLVPSRKHVYRISRISEEITIPYFHPIYLIVPEANTNPNFLVSRRRIPIHYPDLLPGRYKAGRETSMEPSSLVSVGQG